MIIVLNTDRSTRAQTYCFVTRLVRTSVTVSKRIVVTHRSHKKYQVHYTGNARFRRTSFLVLNLLQGTNFVRIINKNVFLRDDKAFLTFQRTRAYGTQSDRILVVRKANLLLTDNRYENRQIEPIYFISIEPGA